MSTTWGSLSQTMVLRELSSLSVEARFKHFSFLLLNSKVPTSMEVGIVNTYLLPVVDYMIEIRSLASVRS